MDTGIKYSAYTQISPERDVTNNAFSKGQINFRLNLDSMSRWNPYRSYFRMRISLTDAEGDPLGATAGIGPNMFQGDCFWQQMNLSCNGVKVSQVDDYYIQIAALKQRMLYDQSRRDTMLADTNFAQASIRDRISQTQEYGFKDDQSLWRPFHELHNNANVFIPDGYQCNVAIADLSRIDITTNGVNPGVISLTESELEVGDHVKIVQNDQDQYIIRKVVGLTPHQIYLNKPVTVFAAATLIRPANTFGSVIYFSKTPPSRRVSHYELIFKPKLGFFDLDEFLPGNFQLELTPWKEGQWQRFAIESFLDAVPGEGGNYNIEVLDFQFYAYCGIATSAVNGTKHYEFSETRCQAQTITNNTLLNKAFVVNPSSHMYTIAFQSGIAGTNTTLSRSKFKCEEDYEQSINRYQLRCGGYTLPTPLPDINKDSDNNIDLSTQQYYEELMYTKSAYLADPESLSEWYERGPFYAYRLGKPIDNPSKRVYVSVEFRAPAVGQFQNFMLLLMDTYYTGFSMTLDNGIVTKTSKDMTLN